MLKTGTLFGMGHYLRLGHYSNNYGIDIIKHDSISAVKHSKIHAYQKQKAVTLMISHLLIGVIV